MHRGASIARDSRLGASATLENLLQVNFVWGELGFSIQHGMSVLGEKKHSVHGGIPEVALLNKDIPSICNLNYL